MAIPRKEGEQRRNNDLLYATLAILPILAVFLAIIFLRYGTDLSAVAVALLWGGACLISGCFVGFLFGIPRVVQSDEAGPPAAKASPARTPAAGEGTASRGGGGYRQLVNTNLVEISDWLTKIIVGLGLVNLQKVPELIDGAAAVLANELPAESYAFATALIVAFSVLGFLMGYLYTRLFLAGAFYRAAKGEGESEELRNVVESNVPDDGGREVTSAQLEAARRVSASPEAKDSASTLALLKDLANQYDQVRRTMTSGPERTQRMEAIVARLRTLALAGYDQLAHFANSASPGERLVAVTMLQVKPDGGYLEWLVDRILAERPFIVYHALEALRRAAETLSESDKRRSGALLETKVLDTDKGKELLATESDRGALLTRILDMLPK
jgi:hypothetical protein